MGKLIVAINILVFTYMSLKLGMQQMRQKNVFVWLVENNVEHLLPILQEHSIQTLEELAALEMMDLNYETLKDVNKETRYQILKVRLKARNEIAFNMWLLEKRLTPFQQIARIIKKSVYEFADMSSREINDVISEYVDLAHQSTLREMVGDFKYAVEAFKDNHMEVVYKKEQYTKVIKQKAGKSYLWKLGEYLNDHPIQIVFTMILVCLNNLAIKWAVPTKIPANTHIGLSIALFYFMPQMGRINLTLVILFRSFVDPLGALITGIVLEMWITMITIYVANTGNLIPISLVPTVLFFLCAWALKLQPLYWCNKKSDSEVLVLSGMGCVDSHVKTYLTNGRINLLTRLIVGIKSDEKIKVENVHILKIEDVDMTTAIVKDVVLPSIEKGNLRELWILNNHGFTNETAKMLAGLMEMHPSLESIHIMFNRPRNIFEIIINMLTRDNAPIKFNSDGAKSILDAVYTNKNKNIKADEGERNVKVLDLRGVELDEEFRDFAHKISQNMDIKVMGSKNPSDIYINSLWYRVVHNPVFKYSIQFAILAFFLYRLSHQMTFYNFN
ncbi:unnamed protein product [Owenia fusiformis]|uniref:Uncharacterized protein n=1 Tax=Owenia fusiformis TaxID=6347 RepID=A0A8J1TV29_OWEFU|nr:unnamed protein product [Owenia fusiformis]